MNDKLEDKVTELIEKLASLAAKLELYIEADKERRKENSLKLQDHEQRLRFLEKNAFTIIGVYSILVTAIGLLKVFKVI